MIPHACPETGGACTGLACPDHWCAQVRAAADRDRQQLALALAEYQRQVDSLIVAAAKRHMDLAITPVELVPCGSSYATQFTFLCLEPGQKPPLGRTWQIYEVGG